MNTLLNDASDASLKQAAILASPYVPWGSQVFWGLARAWVAAASTFPEEREIAPSVINALLRIAFFGLLPPGNQGDVWSWLKLRPSLQSICQGRHLGSHSDVMRQVRGLKDIEILKSYLLIIWLEWDSIQGSGFPTMCEYIREGFSGVEASSHRAELVQRLDEVIGELDRGLAYLRRDRPDLREEELPKRKGQYEELRRILMAIPEAPEIPTCMSSRLINFFDLLTLVEHAQDLTRYSYVRSLRYIRSRLSGMLGPYPPSL